jgi:hypothetical protein
MSQEAVLSSGGFLCSESKSDLTIQLNVYMDVKESNDGELLSSRWQHGFGSIAIEEYAWSSNS